MENLDDYLPDMLFFHPVLCLVALADSLKDVAIVSKFHHNTKKIVRVYVKPTTKCLTAHRKRLPCTRQHTGSWCSRECGLRLRRFLFLCLIDSISSLSWGHRSSRHWVASPCRRSSRNHRLQILLGLNWVFRIHRGLPSFVSSSNCFSDIFRS